MKIKGRDIAFKITFLGALSVGDDRKKRPIPSRLPSQNHYLKSDCSGMTLLEVLVALMIIGVSVGVVFQALAGSRRIAMRAENVLEASRIANNLLSNPVLLNDLMAAGTGAIEDVVADTPGWRYSLTSSPLYIGQLEERDASEIAGILDLQLCLFKEAETRKSFCLNRWYRDQRQHVARPATRRPSQFRPRP
ncbi:MAG: type II secretion system protein [Desulfatirhabdiaceae bacterium]